MRGTSLLALVCVGIACSEAVRTFRSNEHTSHLHSAEADELLRLKRNSAGDFHIGPFRVIRPLKTGASSFLEVDEGKGGKPTLKGIVKMLLVCGRLEKDGSVKDVRSTTDEEESSPVVAERKRRFDGPKLSDLAMPSGWSFGDNGDDDTPDMDAVCRMLERECVDSHGGVMPDCIKSAPIGDDEAPEHDFETVDDPEVASLKKRLLQVHGPEFSDLNPQKLLGKGGKGQVWLVEKEGKKYALKIMFNDPRSRENADKECSVAHHAASGEAGEFVADCYEHRVIGEGVESTAFLLMEFVEGTSLRQVLTPKQGPLPIDKARKYIRQVLSIVKAVGEDGIEFSMNGSEGRHRWIHHDLNPQNIIITPDDSVKIIDWGESFECSPTPPSGSIGQTLMYTDPAPFVVEDSTGVKKFEGCHFSVHCQPCYSYDEFALGAVFYEMVTLETFLNRDVVNRAVGWLVDLLAPRRWELYRKLFTIYPRIADSPVAKDVVSMKDIAIIQQMTYLDPSLRTKPSELLEGMLGE